MKYIWGFFVLFISLNLNALTLDEAIKLALKYNPAIKNCYKCNYSKKRTKQFEATKFG